MTLITDSMAGHFMRTGKIDKIFVGSDRIAANGDVANKIGTYMLAVLANENSIPFYAVAPTSTFDASVPNGDAIVIEERDHIEITQIRGCPVAPSGVTVANPAFDVTPNRYVTGIICEHGLIQPPYDESINMELKGHGIDEPRMA